MAKKVGVKIKQSQLVAEMSNEQRKSASGRAGCDGHAIIRNGASIGRDMQKTLTIDDINQCNDIDALIASLDQCSHDIVVNIKRMAAIVRRLTQLGVNVEIDNALMPFIKMVADGKLLAECLVRCATSPALLQHAIRLSIPSQKRIADDDPFAVKSSDGTVDAVKPSEMTSRQIEQVFSGGQVKSPAKQIPRPNPSKNFGYKCKSCGDRIRTGQACLKCELRKPLELHVEWFVEYIKRDNLSSVELQILATLEKEIHRRITRQGNGRSALG